MAVSLVIPPQLHDFPLPRNLRTTGKDQFSVRRRYVRIESQWHPGEQNAAARLAQINERNFVPRCWDSSEPVVDF